MIIALRLHNGRIEITDPEGQIFHHRFYRFRFDPPAP